MRDVAIFAGKVARFYKAFYDLAGLPGLSSRVRLTPRRAVSGAGSNGSTFPGNTAPGDTALSDTTPRADNGPDGPVPDGDNGNTGSTGAETGTPSP